jgi:hypothetical protein
VPKLPRSRFDEPPPKRGPRRRGALAVAIGLLLIPFVLEGTALCAARWRGLYGPITAARTPFLDTTAVGLQTVLYMSGQTTTSLFRNVPWRASVVIPVFCASAFCGSLLLRRR